MFSLIRTLSLRYLTRHWLRAGLVVVSIALGVAAWIATQSLYTAVTSSLRHSASPLRGVEDFHVSKPTVGFVDTALGPHLKEHIPAIERVEPFLLEHVRIAGKPNVEANLFGLEVPDSQGAQDRLGNRGISIVEDTESAEWKENEKLAALLALKNKFVDPLRRPPPPFNHIIDHALLLYHPPEAPVAAASVVAMLAAPFARGPLLVAAEQFPGRGRGRPFRTLGLESLAHFAQLEPVLVGAEFNRNVLKGRPQFVIEAGRRRVPAIVVGTIKASGAAASLGGHTILMRWEGVAQLRDQPGRAHRLDVVLKPGSDADDVKRQMSAFLGDRADVSTPGEQDQRLSQVMKGLERGFMLCGAGALVVGLFLVYNAMSVSVVERRHDIGILRSVGATRTQVRVLFLAEAFLMGVTGAILGVPLGWGLAQVGVGWIRSVVTVVLTEVNPQLQLTPELLITAGLGGLLTAVVAAAVAASRAAAEEPADAVRRAPPVAGIAYRLLQVGGSAALILLGIVLIAIRSELTQELVVQASLGLVGAGVALIALGNWLLGRTSVADPPALLRHRPLIAIVYGLVFLVIGCAGLIVRNTLTAETGAFAAYVLMTGGALLLSPVLAAALTRVLQRLLRNWLPIESRLALDNLKRSPERTGLVVAALTAGVALMVQTAGMIESSEVAYRDWVNETIKFDFDLRPLSERARSLPSRKVLAESLPPGTRLVGQVKRRINWDAKGKRAVAASDNTLVELHLIDAYEHSLANAGRMSPQHLNLWRQLGETKGRAIVSENFARFQGLKLGDDIALKGNDRMETFRIVGVVEDYAWIRGGIWLDRPHNATAFAAQEVHAWEVYLPEDQRGDAAGWRDRVCSQFGLLGFTQAETVSGYLDIVRRLFSLFYTQQIVVGFVAVIGVVTSLLISVLGRTRELGLLRAVGATRGQVLHTVLAEAVLLGLVGTMLGIVLGLPLEWYLIRVIYFEETGCLFPVRVPWLATGVIAVLSIGAATLAGLAPAFQAIRLRIADAIAYE